MQFSTLTIYQNISSRFSTNAHDLPAMGSWSYLLYQEWFPSCGDGKTLNISIIFMSLALEDISCKEGCHGNSWFPQLSKTRTTCFTWSSLLTSFGSVKASQQTGNCQPKSNLSSWCPAAEVCDAFRNRILKSLALVNRLQCFGDFWGHPHQ